MLTKFVKLKKKKCKIFCDKEFIKFLFSITKILLIINIQASYESINFIARYVQEDNFFRKSKTPTIFLIIKIKQ